MQIFNPNFLFYFLVGFLTSMIFFRYLFPNTWVADWLNIETKGGGEENGKTEGSHEVLPKVR